MNLSKKDETLLEIREEFSFFQLICLAQEIIEKQSFRAMVEIFAPDIVTVHGEIVAISEMGCLTMDTELERRANKRFEIKLPAVISSAHIGNEYHLLLTRDISQNGAYFNMMKPVSYNGPVKVEILIEVTGGFNQCFLYMMTRAEVVRRDDSGLAVIFDEDFMLAPFHI